MAHVTIHGVTDEVSDLVNEFIARLSEAGHSGAVSSQGDPVPAVDPFNGQDIDAIPEDVLTRMGISREELRRGREMRAAVDVNAHHAAATTAAAAPAQAPATPEPAGG